MAKVIPLISNACVDENMKLIHLKIKDCIIGVLYIVLPIALCIFIFSKEISFAFYGNPSIELRDYLHYTMIHLQQLDYETYLLKFRSIEAVFKSLAFMFILILLACKQYKNSMLAIISGIFVKGLVLYVGIQYLGITGASVSSTSAYLVMVILSILMINKIYEFKWLNILKKILIISIGLLLSSLVYLFIHLFFHDITQLGRIGQLPLLVLVIIGMFGIYGLFTAIFKLPQRIIKLKKEVE